MDRLQLGGGGYSVSDACDIRHHVSQWNGGRIGSNPPPPLVWIFAYVQMFNLPPNITCDVTWRPSPFAVPEGASPAESYAHYVSH